MTAGGVIPAPEGRQTTRKDTMTTRTIAVITRPEHPEILLTATTWVIDGNGTLAIWDGDDKTAEFAPGTWTGVHRT